MLVVVGFRGPTLYNEPIYRDQASDTTVSDEAHVPFGGTKMSGSGREGGRYSMEEMTELNWMTVQIGQRAFPF